MAAVLNNTLIPYGSRLISINNVMYILEESTLTRPTTVIERFNEIGEPSGQVLIPGFETGNGTLQLPNTGSRVPALGDQFTASYSGSTPATYSISNISQPESNNTERKVSIEFRRLY